MSMYGKRIWKWLVFTACILGLFAASSALFYPKDNTEEAGMEEPRANAILGEAENTIDILILGDSEAFSFVNPLDLWEMAGYTAYSCGSSGQFLGYTEIMLERAFSRQAPKIVLLDTHILYNEQTWDNVVFEKLCELIPVFRYHNRWKSLKKQDFTDTPASSWTYEYKGYWQSTDIVPADSTDYMSPSDETDPVPAVNRACVRRIKSFCDKHGTKLIFVSSPSTKNWNMKRHHAAQELADDLSCEYLDMNLLTEEIPVDWERDTRDGGDHLNDYGAEKVAVYLTGYLAETGLLDDHRGDPVYDAWNEALKEV